MPKTGVYLQNACLQHKYLRSKDTSSIVERPERLRATTIGLAAAIARLEELFPASATVSSSNPSDLADSLNKLSIRSSPFHSVSVVHSDSTVDMMSHPAVKFVHGDIERDVYLENLRMWAKESLDKIAKGESEIPQEYSQGDLYLCPGSINAIQGAVGTVCESVDDVVSSDDSNPLQRAFVAVRPPGHHCGEDTPSGFCFLNNVAIGAAHAHLKHGIKRVVIFDIDLHHGNGTQSIAWQINEETYRQTLESEHIERELSETKPGLQVFYGSVHDILSYPCEDGKAELVQAASVSIHRSHGQNIENVHLQTYTSEDHFWDVLYKKEYSKLITRAQEFLDHTGGPGGDVLFFISCGMDACEHEYESMSRHNRKVPTSFYYRFGRDACLLADKYARGRLISVLEGGYSDRALISGAMAHLAGIVDLPNTSVGKVDEKWWSLENLEKLEIATKKRRGGRPSLTTQTVSAEPWIQRTLDVLDPIDEAATRSMAAAPRVTAPIQASTRTLRERNKPSPSSSPARKPISATSVKLSIKPPFEGKQPHNQQVSSSAGSSPLTSPETTDNDAPKKLPKVILKLGKAPETGG